MEKKGIPDATFGFEFCIVMISRSRTESEKIVVQTRVENIEIKLDKSVFRSFLGPSVVL